MKNIIFISIFLTIISFSSVAQNKEEFIYYHLNDTNNTTINNYYFKLIKKGFICPKLELLKDTSLFILKVKTGIQYKKIAVIYSSDKIEEFSTKDLGTILENEYNQLINNGYPFCKIALSNIKFERNEIFAEINIEKGPFIKWGQIQLKGNASLNLKILYGIIGIKEGDPFSEQTFESLDLKINQLPYISVFRKSVLLFEEERVSLYLYLNSKPISNISGTIGIQQNSITKNYFLIGDLKAKLVNQIKRGETFDFQWRRIEESTQSLKIGINYPSILKSNFGFDEQLNIYKKDSSYIEIKNNIGFQFFSSNGFVLKTNFKYQESSILTSKINNSSFGNSKNYLSGISLNKQKLDYLPSPTKGYFFSIDLSIGKREVFRPNETQNKWDNVVKLDYLFSEYIKLYKRHLLKINVSGEVYQAPYYLQNELIRFGGMSTQRGFREDELFGNIRLTQTVEYRYLLEQNSYIFSFFDITHYENHVEKNIYSTPIGFGSGISIGTNQGIFSISYAVGKEHENPILIKNGIIHFGYITFF